MSSLDYAGRFPREERERLGFTEHAGNISKMTALLTCDELPNPSIDTFFDSERAHRFAEFSHRFREVALTLKASAFRVQGRLPQHTDDVDPDEMTVGIIIEADEDFELNSWGMRMPARPGDAFLLDPHRNHGAETAGSFTFLALDVDRLQIPERETLRAIFLKDLDLICGALK